MDDRSSTRGSINRRILDGVVDELVEDISELAKLDEEIDDLRDALDEAERRADLADQALVELDQMGNRRRARGRRVPGSDNLAEEAEQVLDAHEERNKIQRELNDKVAERAERTGKFKEALGRAEGTSEGRQGLTRRIAERRRQGRIPLGDDAIDTMLDGVRDPDTLKRPETQAFVRRVRKPSKRAFRAIKKYFSRVIGPLIALTVAADIASAQGAYAKKGFTGNWLALLAHAISRNTLPEVNVELYRVIGYFTGQITKNMPNSELAEGFAYFQNAFFVELIFRYLSRMSTQDRKLLGKYLRELLNAPETVSDPPRPRRTKPRIVQTPPKPRPATFPDKTDTDLRDEIYMARVRKAYWLRRLKLAEAQLRQAKFKNIYGQPPSNEELKNLTDAVAKIRDRIRQYNDRIKAYERALKEPNRKKGPDRTYDPIKPKADLSTVEKSLERALREKLERRVRELQRRDAQLRAAGREEVKYINELRKLIDRIDDEIRRLREQIEFIERLRREDQKIDKDLARRNPLVLPRDASGAELAIALIGGLRLGIDIWALARRHGIDLTKPPTGAADEPVTIPWEKSIYAGALIHDDLYGKAKQLEGGPATGDLMLRFAFGGDTGEDDIGPFRPDGPKGGFGDLPIPRRPFEPRGSLST